MKVTKVIVVSSIVLATLAFGTLGASAMVHVTHTPHVTRVTPRTTHVTTTGKTTRPTASKSAHAFKSDSVRPGSEAWTNKAYGTKTMFPAYYSNNMNIFQTMWLWSMFSNSQSKGDMTVKDKDGKDHSVTMRKSAYNKWHERGRELVWCDGHVYVIKDNTKVI